MRKFWFYEIGSISLFGISLTDVNQVVQLMILVLALWSAFKALRHSKGHEDKKDKK